jgi:hypothetical protein
MASSDIPTNPATPSWHRFSIVNHRRYVRSIVMPRWRIVGLMFWLSQFLDGWSIGVGFVSLKFFRQDITTQTCSGNLGSREHRSQQTISGSPPSAFNTIFYWHRETNTSTSSPRSQRANPTETTRYFPCSSIHARWMFSSISMVVCPSDTDQLQTVSSTEGLEAGNITTFTSLPGTNSNGSDRGKKI